MLELLLIRAAGTSSCSEDHVADNVRNESVHSQQSNDTPVSKKDISVSIESPINLCYSDRSMQDLGEREVKGLETATVTKSLPTEIQEVLFDVFENKEVAERMQRFKSPKRAIEYVLEGTKNFSENIGKKLKNQEKRDVAREASGNLFSYEGYSLQTHAESILSDFVYILKRFAGSNKNIKEACDIFDELIEGKNLCTDIIDIKDKKRFLEGLNFNKCLKQISDLLNEALKKYDVKAVTSDSIQTSNDKLFAFLPRYLRSIPVDKRGDLADKAKDLADIIDQRNEENGKKISV